MAKRKRIVLSIEEKLKVCEMFRNKIPKTDIMLKYSIGKSTVNDIIKKEESLKNFKMGKSELGISNSAKATKTMKGGMYQKLDSALYLWFRQQREKGTPVTGPILLEKATEFHKLLYADSSTQFNASYGFQWRFCKRFGIKSLAISGEKVSADVISADDFVNSFSKITDGYSLDQVFNCDETGLYYKMLPGRTLTTIHNDPSGTKKVKERVTINACSNASGSIKLPLLFIGKAKNPRCFHGIDKSTLPVVYRSQKNAWINTVIFNDWFQNCFVPDVKKKLTEIGQEPKALLLLDNCSAHPNEDELASSDGLIVAKFLPPNVTSLIQPMDQGVLECLKRIYRKSILKDLTSQTEDDMLGFLKKIDILKVVENISYAWEQIRPETLRKSWRKLIPLEEFSLEKSAVCSETESILNDDFVEQFAALNIVLAPSDINEWFQNDGPGYEHMDEQGIVDLVTAPAEDMRDEEDADENAELSNRKEQCPVSHADAMRMFDDCLTWLRFQQEATVSNTSTLVRLRELAAEKRESLRRQSKIDSFFRPVVASDANDDTVF